MLLFYVDSEYNVQEKFSIFELGIYKLIGLKSGLAQSKYCLCVIYKND